jgi:peptide/nickel transport system ATP-binding protein
VSGVAPTPIGERVEIGAAPGVQPVLEIRDLSIAYATVAGDLKAVSHVDLKLAPGEVVGLAGESGSGKSTLALGACRLLRPPAIIIGGDVIYRGRRIGPDGVNILEQNAKQLRELRWREIAIVFQSAMNALNPVLRVRDQMGDVLDAHLKLSREQRRDRLASLLDLVGIPRERLKSYPHELSGGMRQRVMIAMALAVDPEVVIMDEPTTALDVVVQREILAEIAELQKELQFAVLFITHDLSLLLEVADRIAILYGGRLLELGNSEEIHHRTAHPYTRGLLDSFPSVHGPRRSLAGIPGSPPDLRSIPSGCPFQPRCRFSRAQCADIDMALLPVPGSRTNHTTACPFEMPDASGVVASAAVTAEGAGVLAPVSANGRQES